MPGLCNIRVRMLDDTTPEYELKPSNLGSSLLQEIMKNLDILESDYFGVSFDEGDGITFLDPERQIGKQIKKLDETILNFGVKFFTPDPSQMQDEYTRYLFALQVKRNISDGTLPCSETTALELASYITQAEYGDWNAAECSTTSYLNEMKIFPNPTEDQLLKILQSHKNLIGKKPAEADYSLLDVARRLDLYGVRLYPALDAQNSHISLGVSHAGLLVFQDFKRINTFNWARIRKLSFKRKTFLIKLRNTESSGSKSRSYRDVLIFVMNSRDACKNFWKICVEHHAFFRLEVKPEAKPKPVVLSRGSSFHYSGKTQKELLELVRSSNFHRTNFVRTTSRKRMHNSSVSSPANDTDPRYQLELNSSTNQSHDRTPDTSVASPSSTTTEDQGSYMISASADTSRNVTVADVTPVSPTTPMPEWQLKSASLHSSATPVTHAETIDVDMKGNERLDYYVQTTKNSTNHEELNITDYHDKLLSNTIDSHKNDTDVESVETLLQNVPANDRLSIISNTSNNVGLYARTKSLSFDILRVASSERVAPPLPPKGMRQNSNDDGSYDNLRKEGFGDRERYSLGDYVSDDGLSGIPISKDPFVNDSVVNLSAQNAVMAPEVKAKLGEQKIALGHYAVPKRPPSPPDGQFNSPRWDRTSQILDKEINEAMTQLYKAIGESGPSDEQRRHSKNIVIDGTTPIVISSSDDEKDEQSQPNDSLPLEDDSLLAPIKMNFDDFENLFVRTT